MQVDDNFYFNNQFKVIQKGRKSNFEICLSVIPHILVLGQSSRSRVNERGEPTAFYRWTGWAWETTKSELKTSGNIPAIPEEFTGKLPEFHKENPKHVNMQPVGLGNTRIFGRLCPRISPDTDHQGVCGSASCSSLVHGSWQFYINRLKRTRHLKENGGNNVKPWDASERTPEIKAGCHMGLAAGSINATIVMSSSYNISASWYEDTKEQGVLGPGPFHLPQEIMDHVLRNHVPHNRPMREELHTRWSGVSDSEYNRIYIWALPGPGECPSRMEGGWPTILTNPCKSLGAKLSITRNRLASMYGFQGSQNPTRITWTT